MRHLLLRLEAPLMSFGGDTVDAYGVVRDFPARSMVTGLIANALGWERHETGAHDALQARLVIGSARLREGMRVRDFQTAQLGANDRGWTTRGSPEGRAGGAGTYQSPHIRYRDADADALVVVALRLDPAEVSPDLADIASALDRPERPLFIGRKPFVPSGPLVAGVVEAATIREALTLALGVANGVRAQWPTTAADTDTHDRIEELTDERNWRTGVHAGLRRVTTGTLSVAGAATA